MAQSSRFWTTDGASPDAPLAGYSADQFAAFLKKAFGDGVLIGIGDELAVSGTATPIQVATGACIGAGYFYENTAVVELAIASPAATTGFRVVVRFTWATPEGRLAVSLNADGNPNPPALTQNEGSIYEINLATGTITSAGLIATSEATKKWAYYSTRLIDLDPDSVDTDQLVDGAVEEAKIGALAVTAGKIGAGAVTEGKIGTSAITRGKIATDAINDEKLVGLSVTNPKIATGAVTDVKIGALAVTEAKIAAGAVTEAKIGGGAVTAGKIGINAVTADKIMNSAVTQGKLGTGAVAEAKIADEAVTAAKIGTGAVTNTKLGALAVDDAKIGNRVIKFTKRTGGDINQWDSAGTTVYTPTKVSMVAGVFTIEIPSQGAYTKTVSFPVNFNFNPLVFLQHNDDSQQDHTPALLAEAITTINFRCYYRSDIGGARTVVVSYLAIGYL